MEIILFVDSPNNKGTWIMFALMSVFTPNSNLFDKKKVDLDLVSF